MKREPTEPQGFIKPTGVGIPRLQAGEEVKIVWLMRTEGWGYGEALEYVGCGVVGSLPAAGPRGPVLVRR